MNHSTEILNLIEQIFNPNNYPSCHPSECQFLVAKVVPISSAQRQEREAGDTEEEGNNRICRIAADRSGRIIKTEDCPLRHAANNKREEMVFK